MKAAFTLGLLAMSGCGGPLLAGTTLDQPAFMVSGSIQPMSNAVVFDAPMSLGLLWIDPAQEGAGNWTSGADLVDGEIASDASFIMKLRGLPPTAAIRALAAPSGGTPLAFAFAEIILYEDRDGDGRFAVGPLASGSPMIAPDLYRGMPNSAVLFYVAQPASSADVPLRELAEVVSKSGYSLANADCLDDNYVLGDARTVITMVVPSSSFPDLRVCLRSQPTAQSP